VSDLLLPKGDAETIRLSYLVTAYFISYSAVIVVLNTNDCKIFPKICEH